MHTDSSASFTYFASVSASEWTTTVRMPISRQGRWVARGGSPRVGARGFPHTRGGGCDLVHQLHRLDDADGVALLHRLPDLDEGLGVGRGRAVEGADHRRLDHVTLLHRLGRWRGWGRSRRPGF